MRTSLDDPAMADFVAALDPVNAVADRAPGFVWRLQTEAGDATDVRIENDESLIVNLSVWESVEALLAFMKSSPHATIMQRRREWFAAMTRPHAALWWIDPGHRPDVTEAAERLAHLHAHGPTPHAFTFSKRFPPPG